MITTNYGFLYTTIFYCACHLCLASLHANKRMKHGKDTKVENRIPMPKPACLSLQHFTLLVVYVFSFHKRNFENKVDRKSIKYLLFARKYFSLEDIKKVVNLYRKIYTLKEIFNNCNVFKVKGNLLFQSS